MRVVLDTNVFVSAAIQNGASHRIVQHLIRENSDQLIICDEILSEIRDVLLSAPGFVSGSHWMMQNFT